MNMFFSKRNFLKTTALGLAGITINPVTAFSENEFKKLKSIGLIFNTIEKELKKDVVKTLEKVAEIGYKEVECGSTYQYSPAEFGKILSGLGLKAIAGGCAMKQFLGTNFDKMAEEANLLGKKYLVCYWAWLDSGENKTIDDFKKVAAQFNQIGEKCKKAGLQFAFHNHDKEFKPTEGKIPYDIILENTDYELVSMELDLYWIVKGGANPIPYLEKYPKHFSLFHIKDMDKTATQGMACVGQGLIDFESIFAKANNVKHFIVEHDHPSNPIDCIKASYDFLKQLRF
jgi:sugar phosphate isomerase/epimerase